MVKHRVCPLRVCRSSTHAFCFGADFATVHCRLDGARGCCGCVGHYACSGALYRWNGHFNDKAVELCEETRPHRIQLAGINEEKGLPRSVRFLSHCFDCLFLGVARCKQWKQNSGYNKVQMFHNYRCLYSSLALKQGHSLLARSRWPHTSVSGNCCRRAVINSTRAFFCSLVRVSLYSFISALRPPM